MASDAPEGRTAGDWIYASVKAGISAIPLAGGPLAEILGFLVVAPASRRRDEWLGTLCGRLDSLEGRIPGLLGRLPSNEDFVSAALHATQVAMRSHQNEKLSALRNAVLNVATGAAPDSDRQLMFLTWVDAFTATHLAFLGSLTPGCSSETRAELRARMSEAREFNDSVIGDLNARGLLVDPRPFVARNRDSAHPLVSLQWSLSKIGQQFVAFISDPQADAIPHK